MTSLNDPVDISSIDPVKINNAQSEEKDIFRDSPLHLVDFGFATKYLISNNQNSQYHIH